MTHEDRDRPVLSARERRFVGRLEAAFGPAPMTPARRAALDARVERRLARRRWPAAAAPALLLASIAAAFVWNGRPPAADRPAPVAEAAGAEVAPDAWERRLFYSDLSGNALEEDESGVLLPPDYAAIESLFFGG